MKKMKVDKPILPKRSEYKDFVMAVKNIIENTRTLLNLASIN